MVGALCYLAIGSETVRIHSKAAYKGLESHKNYLAMGSLAIINGIVLLLDAAAGASLARKSKD